MIWRPQSFAAKAGVTPSASTLAVTTRAARSERRTGVKGQGAVGAREVWPVSRTEVMPTFGDCKRCVWGGSRPPAMVASPPMLPARLAGTAMTLAAPAVLLAAAIFFGGGSGNGSVWWLGLGCVGVLGASLTLG